MDLGQGTDHLEVRNNILICTHALSPHDALQISGDREKVLQVFFHQGAPEENFQFHIFFKRGRGPDIIESRDKGKKGDHSLAHRRHRGHRGSSSTNKRVPAHGFPV